MKIDTHVHIFDDKIIERASSKLTDISGLPRYTDFSEAQTRQNLKNWGIDLGVVLPIATKPSQQETINNWAASLMHDNLISFGSIHPLATDARDELRRIKELGLYGVKMHPDYQEFFADDERLYPLFEEMAALKLPLYLHTGFDPLSPDLVHAMPDMVARLHHDLPGLTLIAAHMGGVKYYDEVEKHIVGTDIYIDTSMSPLYCSQAQFTRIVKEHGTDKVLFASDLPWSDPHDEMDMLERAQLSKEQSEQVYWQNATSVLSIPESLLTSLRAGE